MNRFLKVISSVALVVFFAACNKNDDSVTIEPPRNPVLQYQVEKPLIEEYLQTHYIASVDANFNVDIQPMPENPTTEISLWDDQETYPLQSKPVTLSGVDYTLYYIVLREGVNENPTLYDQIKVAYNGSLLDRRVFDSDPFPQSYLPLQSTIAAWREILPLFKSGNYVDIPGSPDPATYQGYGAGLLFTPSGLGYYNAAKVTNNNFTIPSYSPLVFSFKLYDVDWIDHDNDGIYTRFETIDGVDPANYDTDGDGIPNYLDVDDDNDTILTRAEIRIPGSNPVAYYDFENIPDCNGGLTGTKKHLDPACQ